MNARIDEAGRAHKKSQLQIQLYVNRREAQLTEAALAALPSLAALDPELEWVSPLENDAFREYYDAGFLERIRRAEVASKLAEFWPAGGPHWDALAVASSAGGEYLGPLLVEAKSYPAEMYSAIAASPPSHRRIRERLADTRAWLGVPDEAEQAWLDRLYQAANRVAHLYWFRELLGEQAWLLNAYFLDDPNAPTSRERWGFAIAEAEQQLGLVGREVPHSGKVFLEAGERDELLGPSRGGDSR